MPVRRAGSFSEQWALLFRDYLRTHREEAARYEAVKRRLAIQSEEDRHAYTDAKVSPMWAIIRQADDWAQARGWFPGPGDA
ncbi:MAG TPA: GrpB family protein [Actinomycetota bacterium]|nr:GrpB family protein [Actinomycetota bacterium]